MKTLLQHLRETATKTFVLVMGGAGVGKNYYIEHNPRLKDFTLIDIDEIKRDGSSPNAMIEMKRQMEQAFKRGEDVVQPTIGGTAQGNVNKLKLAKSHGYNTEVIYLKGSADKGKANVLKRASNGGHSVPEGKVDLTYERAEDAYQEIARAADKAVVVHV